MQFTDEALKYLNLGISGEIAAYVFYKKAAAVLTDKALREAVLSIAGEEKRHFLKLEDVYDATVRSEMWAPYKHPEQAGLPDIDELVRHPQGVLARIAGIPRSGRARDGGSPGEGSDRPVRQRFGEIGATRRKQVFRIPDRIRNRPRQVVREGRRRCN